MKYVGLAFITILMIGCKSKFKIIGVYRVQKNSEIVLNIKSDSTFTLYNGQVNPYLHPYEHPDEYFWMTTGKWHVENQQLYLNSDSNACYPDSIAFIESKPLQISGFELAFLDFKNDTIPILSVRVHDSLEFARLKGSMKSIKVDNEYFTNRSNGFYRPPNVGDTLKILFYGYPPTFLPFKTIQNKSHTYRKYPRINRDAFYSHPLKIRKGGLLEKHPKMKFEKEKTAGNNMQNGC